MANIVCIVQFGISLGKGFLDLALLGLSCVAGAAIKTGETIDEAGKIIDSTGKTLDVAGKALDAVGKPFGMTSTVTDAVNTLKVSNSALKTINSDQKVAIKSVMFLVGVAKAYTDIRLEDSSEKYSKSGDWKKHVKDVLDATTCASYVFSEP